MNERQKNEKLKSKKQKSEKKDEKIKNDKMKNEKLINEKQMKEKQLNQKKVKIQQIRIDFNVTPEIKRYVFIYLIIGNKGCYLIDAGVDGAEKSVHNYLSNIGRKITDIKAIFLTHAHPDHIGSAAKIKEMSGCKIYASKGESAWIQDIELQFRERPIPNFHVLVNQSVKVDEMLKDGDQVALEPEITLQVVSTPGHSCDALSYIFNENQCIFTGDAIPVKEDIPIWINAVNNEKSLRKLQRLAHINTFYPAWDETYNYEQGMIKIKEALELMRKIKEYTEFFKSQSNDLEVITKNVCHKMNTPYFLNNPLFKNTIIATISCTS